MPCGFCIVFAYFECQSRKGKLPRIRNPALCLLLLCITEYKIEFTVNDLTISTEFTTLSPLKSYEIPHNFYFAERANYSLCRAFIIAL